MTEKASPKLPLGMEMLLNSLLKLLNIDPEQVKKSIADIVQITVNAHRELAAINRKLDILLKERGLSDDHAETADPQGTLDGPDAVKSGNGAAAD